MISPAQRPSAEANCVATIRYDAQIDGLQRVAEDVDPYTNKLYLSVIYLTIFYAWIILYTKEIVIL